MRIQVKGDILSLEEPAKAWLECFKPTEKFEVSSSLARDDLTYGSTPCERTETRARSCQAKQGRHGSIGTEAGQEGDSASPEVPSGSYELIQIPEPQLVVFGLSSIESSFAYHVAKGPDSWTHLDQPALTVARAVLNA